MLRSLRVYRTDWLAGGLHLLIFFVAVQFESAAVWPYALAAMAAVSFFAWMGNFKRYRQIHDVPTSRIASAAQGYAEFFGHSALIPDAPVTAPLSNLPCCWYRYCIEEKSSDNKWSTADEGESVSHFLLVDDTGECVVSPDGAEILYPRKSVWTQGSLRYTEWLLLPRGVLYAIGDFRTMSSNVLELDKNREISHLLADWKADEAHLLERFDSNRDGTLDLQEWEAARIEARREVEKQHAATREGVGVHLLCKPADGRVFILAAELPEKLGRRFALWSWLHLAAFFVGGTASYLMLTGAR